MNASMTRRDLGVFLSTLFAVTWALELTAIVRVGDLNQKAAIPYLLLGMFLPAIATFAWLWRRPALRQEVRWRLGRVLPSLAGALIPAATALVAVMVMVALGWGSSRFFALGWSGVDVVSGPFKLGLGPQSWPYFLANFFLTGLLFAIVNSAATVGEEIGWRGFLQHQMIARFGLHRGIALLGLVWAFWHLPANLAGYNFPEHPILGALVLFPVQLVAASFTMAWLTLRAGSFWPAVLYHGSINGILQGVAIASIVPARSRLLVDLVVVAVEVAVGICAASLLAREAARQRLHARAVARHGPAPSQAPA